MKKVLLLVVVMSLAFAAGVFAASDIKLYVNGKLIDAPVELIDDSSYIPLRVVAESLGAEVIWDDYTRSIKINSQPSKQQGQKGTYVVGNFSFSDVQVKQNDFGWDITADIQNNGDDIKGATFTITFTGDDGKRIGTALGSVQNLKNNESKTIRFVTMDDLKGYTTIKFQVDSSY